MNGELKTVQIVNMRVQPGGDSCFGAAEGLSSAQKLKLVFKT